MAGIPPALDTDVEDVVWALQTADALWKRNERGDALVWLRRAAQAAGEANDDGRALTLARGAAELTESMTHASATSLGSAPPKARGPSGIEDLLRKSSVDAVELTGELHGAPPPPLPPMPVPPVMRVGVSDELALQHPAPSPSHSAKASGDTGPIAEVTASQPPSSQRVLTAAESHAGMLDPWAEPAAPRKPPRPPPAKPAHPPQDF